MTKQEEKQINELVELAKSLKKENENFKATFSAELKNLQEQIANKHEPFNLEKAIFQAIQNTLNDAVKQTITGYNSPIRRIAENAFAPYESKAKRLIDQSLQVGFEGVEQELATIDAKTQIRKSLAHQILRAIFESDGKVFAKITHDLKIDPIFRSKLTLAIDNLLQEYAKL